MAMLKGRCALEATQRATADDLAQLQRLHGGLERHAATGDVDGYYRVNHEFHSLVQALAANRWLENYPYRIQLGWSLFALGAMLVLGIALLTVSFQSIKAALQNPVRSLKVD